MNDDIHETPIFFHQTKFITAKSMIVFFVDCQFTFDIMFLFCSFLLRHHFGQNRLNFRFIQQSWIVVLERIEL